MCDDEQVLCYLMLFLCVINACFMIVRTNKCLNSIIYTIMIYRENNYSITTLVF